MTCRLRVSGLAALLALAGCGGGDDSAQDPVDESLGLDARPHNPKCLGGIDFPKKLSDHPCFEGSPPEVSPALVPYNVNAPLWSDGAEKMRYLAVPDGEALHVQRDGGFDLPPGGVLVKEFASGATRLETRLLTRDEDGEWHAATYVWNDTQTDALLTEDGAEINLGDETWFVPSSEQCFDCHTEAAGTSLGLEQRQMALTMEYPGTGRRADQIHTLTELGLLEGESNDEPLTPPQDLKADEDDRARAYLHANCSHCHRPGGLGQGELDLRASTPFRLTKTCNEVPVTSDPIDGGGLIIAPGDPLGSSLYVRMVSDDPTWRMPPVGSHRVDVLGSELMNSWIASMSGCPE